MGYVIYTTLVIHIVIHRGPGKMWAKSHATRRVESCILGQGMLLFSYKKLTKVVKEKDKK